MKMKELSYLGKVVRKGTRPLLEAMRVGRSHQIEAIKGNLKVLSKCCCREVAGTVRTVSNEQ